jgi:molecular chaperone DnaK (HSP70)
MKEKFELHFDQYEKILVNENHNIPSILYKTKNETLIGYEALEKCENDFSMLNKNFKIGVGQFDNTRLTQKDDPSKTSSNEQLSPMRQAELFLNKVLDETSSNIELRGFPKSENIIIAEPLRPHSKKENTDSSDDDKWLQLYRKNIKKYFQNKGFKNIQFLPEPFAVFQYYKYGKKFASLNQNEQLLVLLRIK